MPGASRPPHPQRGLRRVKGVIMVAQVAVVVLAIGVVMLVRVAVVGTALVGGSYAGRRNRRSALYPLLHCGRETMPAVFMRVWFAVVIALVWGDYARCLAVVMHVFFYSSRAVRCLIGGEDNDAVGKADAPAQPEKTNKRMPGEGDDCPICYDSAYNVPEKNLTFCETCGNAVHSECFGQWKQTCRTQGKDLTCIWCRAKWPVAAAGAGGSGAGANLEEGYVNLASAAGVSTMRDTSSYYDGPRRGERYYGGGYGGIWRVWSPVWSIRRL
ncbi:hypothetical protein MKEN_00366400 [Mycena kentingensis (nom. inval.)]|nr:hypothetical protein MKEN_00366400 [Mycena kentingensis (nom. inval.)]